MSVTSERVDVDVVVVGAGPAGSAAATVLARAGKDVVVIDRAKFPRDKCCGDGLTTGALRRLEMLGLDPHAVASYRAVPDLTVRSPSGRTFLLPFRAGPGVFAAVARRRDLDTSLVDVARSSGATVLEGERCTGVATATDGSVALSLSAGREFRARFVVAADGAWSEVRKLAHAETETPARPDWIAFRTYVSDVRREATEHLWVWFVPDLLPGYAWSFPLKDGTLNVGIAAPASSGRALAGAWRSTLNSPFLESLVGPSGRLDAPARAWPIPTTLEASRLVGFGDRILFVGDAAGAADPFTGEGIGQALETGMLAAEAIADSDGRPGSVAERYRRSVQGTLGRDHRLSLPCHRLFSRRVGASAALRIADCGPFMRRNVARWLFEDYSRSIAAKPASWSDALRRAPGAFARQRVS